MDMAKRRATLLGEPTLSRAFNLAIEIMRIAQIN
jgi:hypothetical protein